MARCAQAAGDKCVPGVADASASITYGPSRTYGLGDAGASFSHISLISAVTEAGTVDECEAQTVSSVAVHLIRPQQGGPCTHVTT